MKKPSFITPLKHLQNKHVTQTGEEKRYKFKTNDLQECCVWSRKLCTKFQSISNHFIHNIHAKSPNQEFLSFTNMRNCQNAPCFAVLSHGSGLVQLPNKVVALHSLEPSAPELSTKTPQTDVENTKKLVGVFLLFGRVYDPQSGFLNPQGGFQRFKK